jgi:hypothetical protein
MSEQGTEVELPALPRGKLTKVTDLAQELQRELRRYIGSVMTSELAKALSVRAATVLGDQNLVDQESVTSSLAKTFEQYNGQEFSPYLNKILSWQISARLDELHRGMLVQYTRPLRQEWIAVEIVDVQPSVWRGEKRGCLMTFFVLSGHPAGHTVTRNFPESWLRGFAYQIGFSRRIQYDEEPKHFIGLRIWGYLQPDETSPEISFERWEISPAFRKHNLSVIKLRTRLDYEHRDNNSETGRVECPYGFTHYCWDCPKRSTECPASCRPRS